MPELKGMTWDHTRGYDPMLATGQDYAQWHPGVRITWEERSLQAFADHPIEELAAEFDLIVIDHPHVGIAARHGCLVPLDTLGRDDKLQSLAAQSLGPSHATYEYAGHQWALAIDAATQVASYRPDLLMTPPRTWAEVLVLARAGKVLWPLKPIDALMSFFTLAANRGTPCNIHGETTLLPYVDGMAVLEALSDLGRLVPLECLTMNPIEVYERLIVDDRFAYCPLAYGYTNYARDGYRRKLLHFANIPVLGEAPYSPGGSCIGGTGISISSRCRHIDIAADYAFWIASADCQRGLYFDAGGQPGNALAWDDDRTNRLTHNFFRDTRATLDATYVRPRYDGYLDFQDRGGTVVNAFLAGNLTADFTMKELQRLYEKSLAIKDTCP